MLIYSVPLLTLTAAPVGTLDSPFTKEGRADFV